MSIKSIKIYKIVSTISTIIHHCPYMCEVVPYTVPCFISDNFFTPKYAPSSVVKGTTHQIHMAIKPFSAFK